MINEKNCRNKTFSCNVWSVWSLHKQNVHLIANKTEQMKQADYKFLRGEDYSNFLNVSVSGCLILMEISSFLFMFIGWE